MKVRSGFVSNSSSSSFILKLKCTELPRNINELCAAINLSEKSIRHDVAEYILSRITHRIVTKEEFEKIAYENLENRAYYEIWRKNDRIRDSIYRDNTLTPEKRMEALNNVSRGDEDAAVALAKEVYIRERFEERFNLTDGCVVCIELSDNDGEEGSEAEHGNNFRGITHEIFSNH